MTKDEALLELQKGKKVTHRFFSDGEFMYQNGDTYVLEDGVRCHPMVFWEDRATKQWETGWSVIEENKVTLHCIVCNKEFQGEEPVMCCSGRDCGCMGMPIDPIVCSDECFNKLS